MRGYRRRVRRMSAAMLVVAVLVRLLTQTGLEARAGQALAEALCTPRTAQLLFYMGSGRALTAPDGLERILAGDLGTDAAEPAAPSGPPVPASGAAPDTSESEAAPAAQSGGSAGRPGAQSGEAASPDGAEGGAPAPFTAADAAAISIRNQSGYAVDPAALLLEPSKLDFSEAGPAVLIVHTHTSEAYTQEAGWEYEENETARTQNPDFSVLRVGRELAETLEENGVSVIHDESFNDYPSYSGAYDRTLTKIEAWLKKYPSIQVVLDVHRDAAANADGTPVRHAAVVDGEETARLMLVVGTDAGGLAHPDWRDRLSWALKLQATLNRMYPGLCRDLDLRAERFNQHAAPGSLLVEVGSSGNTLKEALAAARDLGEGLAALIQSTP